VSSFDSIRALRGTLAVLRVALVAPEANVTDNGAGFATGAPPETEAMVAVQLELSGVVVRSWEIAASEIRLPVRPEDLLTFTRDALSRAKAAVLAASPSNVLWNISERLEGRAHLVSSDLLADVLASMSTASAEAAGQVGKYLSAKKTTATRTFEEYQRSLEQRGIRVKPEDLRALRDSYKTALEVCAGALQGFLSSAHSKFDTLTDERAEYLRSKVPYPSLPMRVVRGINEALADAAGDYTALWVEVARPGGYLAVLPWDELLAPASGLPVMRLPYQSLNTLRRLRSMKVVLCCTAPTRNLGPSAAAVFAMAREIGEATPDVKCTVHVFADREYYPEFGPLFADASDATRGRVLLHSEPPDWSRGEKPERVPVDAQWTGWIRQALKGEAADVFHIVAPGHFAGAEPVAIVSSTPWTGEPAGQTQIRQFHGWELADAMSMLGASVAVCTAFGSDTSILAWRLLADEIARACPGAIAVHEFARETSDATVQSPASGLSQLYQFLARPLRLPQHPAITLYVHPAYVGQASSGVPYEEARSTPVPLWAAATRRRAEQVASGSFSDRDLSEAERAAYEGSRAAFQFVSDTISSVLANRSKPGVES
jgi:hypothetical protein